MSTGFQNRRATVRQRPYHLLVYEGIPVNDLDSQTLKTPSKGFRMRIVRIRGVQPTADGIHHLELYFGTQGNIITAIQNGDQGIDILVIPDLGSDSTRTYLRNQGPRGQRDQPLTCRWRGTAPANDHKITIEYTEEP